MYVWQLLLTVHRAAEQRAAVGRPGQVEDVLTEEVAHDARRLGLAPDSNSVRRRRACNYSSTPQGL